MVRMIEPPFYNSSLRILRLKAESKEESWKKLNILITFVFCTENDVSDQTLESYKSKSNEDSPGHEKNGHGKSFNQHKLIPVRALLLTTARADCSRS